MSYVGETDQWKGSTHVDKRKITEIARTRRTHAKKLSVKEKAEIKRRREGYPHVCLKCGSKTRVVEEKILYGKTAGKFQIFYDCQNPRCKTRWGGYV